MNNHSNTSNDIIDDISNGYRGAQILFTAVRLGLFNEIGRGSKSLEQLSHDLKADSRGIRILCDALVSLSILEKANHQYMNAPAALEHLLPDSPYPKNDILLHSARLYAKWVHLYDVIIEGKPVDVEKFDTKLAYNEEAFAKAMADIGRHSAKQTAELLDLSNTSYLLEVGGGPGLYAIEFAKQNQNLEIDLLDNEKTLDIAKTNIENAKLQNRIHLLPGDVFELPLQNQYDFIFISNLVHIYSYEKNLFLVKKCAEALRSGGRICIKDFLVNPDRTSPQWSTLFAVNMLVNTEEGNCYTSDEIQQWYAQAGLEIEALKNVATQSYLVIGRK